MVVVKNVYQKTLDATDFGMTVDKTLIQNEWTLVGTYTVPSQQEVSLGATEIIQGGANGKCAYIRLDHTDATQLTSMAIRVKIEDANDDGETATDHSANEWSADKTDRNKCLLLHLDHRRAVEDSKIKIYAKHRLSDAVVDVSDADTVVQIPVTVYTIRR